MIRHGPNRSSPYGPAPSDAESDEPTTRPMLQPFAPLALDLSIQDGEMDVDENGNIIYGPGIEEHMGSDE